MLDRKGQAFHTQEVAVVQHAIEINTQRVRGQFAIQPRHQAAKGMGMVVLKLKLLAQLAIHHFHDLARMIHHPVHGSARLLVLGPACARHDDTTGLCPQFSGLRLPDVRLVPNHDQVLMVGQQLVAGGNIRLIRRGQFEVQNHPVERDEHRQFVAKDGLPFGRHAPKGCSSCLPIGVQRGRGHTVKGHDWHGQAVDRTLVILRHIQDAQHDLPDQIEAQAQGASPTVGATLGRQVREQVPMQLPPAQRFRLHVPAQTLADQEQGQQLAPLQSGTSPGRAN